MNYKIIKKSKSENWVGKLPEYQRFSRPLEALKTVAYTLERKEGGKKNFEF
jgi:hypothetical protein